MADDLFETIFDNLQEIRTQQLLSDAVLQEAIEYVSSEIDRIDIQLEAIKRQLISNKPNTQENLDQLIKEEHLASLKRRLLNTTKRLMYLLEQKSKLGEIDTPYSLINDINQTEEEIIVLRTQIEQYGRIE